MMRHAGTAGTIKDWQGKEGHPSSTQLWREQEKEDIVSDMMNKDMRRRGQVKEGDTWQELKQKRKGDRKGKNMSHYPNNSPSRRSNYDMTCKLQGDRRSSAGNIPGNLYLTSTKGKGKSIVLSCSRPEPIYSAESTQNYTVSAGTIMAGEGSRNASANKDLKVAREMYETCTSQKNKRKIIDLEAMVHEEEKKLSEQEIEEEVDWLQDPGTVTTQATQFVRTQAKSWRMKTLLAKALSMQDNYAEQLQKVQHISEAKTEEHIAILESLEFKVSALEQQVDSITKKLTVLIKLLRHTIGQDTRQAEN